MLVHNAYRHTVSNTIKTVKAFRFSEAELTALAQETGAIGPEAVEAACRAYHDLSLARTSTLSARAFQDLFTYYLKDILLDGERLAFALDVQERFLTPREMAAAYSALLGRTISDPRRALRHALSPSKEPGHA